MTKENNPKSSDWFMRSANFIARWTGHPQAFMLATSTIVLWAITGPLFHYSDTWQLVINTSTTIITFLMVFLIQNTQNRDTAAIHLKLDELLRVMAGTRENMLDVEDLGQEQLDLLKKKFIELAETARKFDNP